MAVKEGLRQASQGWDSLWVDLVIPVYILSLSICRMLSLEVCPKH